MYNWLHLTAEECAIHTNPLRVRLLPHCSLFLVLAVQQTLEQRKERIALLEKQVADVAEAIKQGEKGWSTDGNTSNTSDGTESSDASPESQVLLKRHLSDAVDEAETRYQQLLATHKKVCVNACIC